MGCIRGRWVEQLAAIAVLLAAGWWHSGAAAADDGPRRLACSFASGTVSTYDKGVFASAKAETLGFELDDIDLERQSARIVASPGAAPGSVRVVRAINANHYLEVANEGFLNLTTVYDRDPATGAHPAVHSRHFGLLGQPVYAQYTGHCQPR